MGEHHHAYHRIAVIGEGKLADSILTNLVNAKHQTTQFTMESAWPSHIPCNLVIAITDENEAGKKQLIQRLESRVHEDTIIAVNSESIPLEDLQAISKQPSRILGLNWSYPADLSLFLEIVVNDGTARQNCKSLEALAKEKWGKDPYIAYSGFSLRARMMAAWAREAIYLVENDYASMESVDRACRNDAGYYLPFAGNFRYMDLMGTYAYGMVMKDLNPELSNDVRLPDNIADDASAYAPNTSEEKYRQFSEAIRALILKYDHETFDS